MTIDDLKAMPGVWYLATPYTRYKGGLEAAFRDACGVAAELMKAGVPTFSPIAHSHPIACYGEMSLTDHELWMGLDRPHMEAAVGCIVAMLPGWEVSRGVAHEIDYFKAAGKPYYLLDPSTMEIA